MKLLVVGTCQAIPLAKLLAAMHPQVRVERFRAGADVAALAEPGDLIFRQRESFRMTPGRRPANETIYPSIWFAAFHPDLAVVTSSRVGVAPAPLGVDHSALATFGYVRGLSVAQTLALFCEPVFARLGYFDIYEGFRKSLLAEAQATGFPFDDIFPRLERSGCFMHTPLHPHLVVMAEIARELSRRAGLATSITTPERFMEDPMLRGAVWQVYPEVGERLGVLGSYTFKPASHYTEPALMTLEDYVVRAFDAFSTWERSDLELRRFESPEYADIEAIAARERRGSRDAARKTPYSTLPDERFWRRAVSDVSTHRIDPASPPPFPIASTSRIATTGSCFAQHIGRHLMRNAYTFYCTEPPHDTNETVFSTRSGNVYTARQLLQLFLRAYGRFTPHDVAWQRSDGRWIDPFRPQMEPAGFASPDATAAARDAHLACVREMFEGLDIFVFTAGLTEAWRSRRDGAVFPLAPGVHAGEMSDAYEFVNFSAAETRDDVLQFVELLRTVNPSARVILSVSPQPPIATYEPQHILLSSTETKAALRVAFGEAARTLENVWYFPSYEMIAGAHTRGIYFEQDLRTVSAAGVTHVMSVFFGHCAPEPLGPPPLALLQATHDEAKLAGWYEFVCDEDLIDDASRAGDRGEHIAAGALLAGNPFQEFEDIAMEPAFAVTEPMLMLEPHDMRAPIGITLPEMMEPRKIIVLPCTIANNGERTLTSSGRNAVYFSYRWFDADGALTEVGHAIHTPLPFALEPGASVTLNVRIVAPRYEGVYLLRASVLQSEIAWFDDIDPLNGAAAEISVAEHAAPKPQPPMPTLA